MPDSSPRPGLLPCRASGARKLHRPRCPLLLEGAAPPPAPAHAACLTSPVPGCQEPLCLGHGCGRRWEAARSCAREPLLRKEAEERSELPPPSASSSPGGGGGERKRPGTGCLSQRHNPLSRPRPLFLPCHRPGGGMAEGPWVCAAHPPSTHPDSGSPRGPAKAADRGGGARPFLRAFLLQCPERGQGPGGHGRHRLGCPPRG